MDNFEKLMLKIYPGIDKVIVSVDTAINTRILTSFYNDTSNYEQTEKILKLMEKKEYLLRLKGLIDSAISNVNEEKKAYLKFYGTGGRCRRPDEDKVSRRTFYRKLSSAVNAFSSELKRLGVQDWYDENMRGNGFFDYYLVGYKVYRADKLKRQ